MVVEDIWGFGWFLNDVFFVVFFLERLRVLAEYGR